jgi:HEAT repeat protein
MRLWLPVLVAGVAALAILAFLLRRGGDAVDRGNYLSIRPAPGLAPEVHDLVVRLGSSDAVERGRAVLELHSGGMAPMALPYLARLLEDRTPIRVERDATGAQTAGINTGAVGYHTCPGDLAARTLADCGEGGVQALLKGMSHPSDNVRRSALEGAARARDPRIAGRIVEALADQHRLVRQSARLALKDMGPLAVQPLAEGMRHPDEPVRLGAAEVLAKLGGAQAFEALFLAAAGDSPAPTIAAARHGIAQVSDPRCTYDLIALLPEASVRPQAVALLARMNPVQKTSLLVAALGDPDHRIRAGAAHGLAIIGDPNGIEALRRAERDEHPEVRRQAGEALKTLTALKRP